MEPQADATYEVQNIVATIKFRKKLKLWLLELADVKEMGDITIQYIPENFPGAVIRFQYPKVSVTLFSNGSGVLAGAKNIQEVNLATKRVIQLIRHVEYKSRIGDKNGVMER